MTKSYHPSQKKEENPHLRFTWLLDAKQVITDIAHGEADLDTLKAGASLIPAAKITKVPKVVKAIGNVGKTRFKKGKEGEKPFGSGLHRKTSQNLIRIKKISQKQVVRVVQQHLMVWG